MIDFLSRSKLDGEDLESISTIRASVNMMRSIVVCHHHFAASFIPCYSSLNRALTDRLCLMLCVCRTMPWT
jgi:hypothetical protein